MLETPSLLQLHLQQTEPKRESEEPSNEGEDSEAGSSGVKTELHDSLLFDALMSQENTEPQDSTNGESATPKSEKPNWFPSRSSRSIVWDHISWIESTQRAACNYCSAEFQIKGGTSAVLRHLKTIHPQNIDFDPTLEPVRKRKKKTEDNVVVLSEDSSYMDTLLKQFWPNGEMSGLNVESENGEGEETKNELEFSEVIKSLQKQQDNQAILDQVASTSTEPSTTATANDSDRDIRKILGILDEQTVVEDIGVGTSSSPQPTTSTNNTNHTNATPTKQVNGKHGKFSLALLSSIKKANAEATPRDNLPPPPPPPPPTLNGSKLEYESRVLYNQSLHSTIVRENAMTNYYNLKSRYLQLTIQKLEKELQQQ